MKNKNLSNIKLPKGANVTSEDGKFLCKLEDEYVAKSQTLINSQRKFLTESENSFKREDNFNLLSVSVLSSPETKRLLSNAEVSFIVTVLSKYLYYKDNTLRVGGHFNGSPITPPLLAKLEGIGESTSRNMIASLKKKRVLAHSYTGGEKGYGLTVDSEIKEEVLSMNPYIMTKGKTTNGICSLFANSIWADIYYSAIKSE